MIDPQVIESYVNAGLHLIPLQPDKSPVRGWKWKDIVPTAEDLQGMPGDFIGMACGDGIEVIDFDLKYDPTGKLFDEYCDMVEVFDSKLLKKSVVQKTMNNGYHFIYRCEEIEGNKKLARRMATPSELSEDPMDKLRVLIETRGQGGYIAIYPSPGYSLIQGKFNRIPILTVKERKVLLDAAKAFDSIPIADPGQKKVERDRKSEWTGGKSPFDDYNERGDVLEVLFSRGWSEAGHVGENIMLKRPGSANRHGATFHTGRRVLYVFSSSSEFDQNKGYSPVGVYAKLNHNDDYSAAAKSLIDAGFGEKGVKPREYVAYGDQEEKTLGNSLANSDKDEVEIQKRRRGEIEGGISTGFESLDPYWLHKPGSFIIVNGHSGSGKTVLTLYIFLAAALKYKWRFAIYSGENRTSFLKIKIMEFYSRKRLARFTDEEYALAKKIVDDHFVFIDNDKLYTAYDLLTLFEGIHKEKPINYGFIDPYNGLLLPEIIRGKTSYNVHMEIAGAFRVFTKRTGASLFVAMHPFSEASRRIDKQGFSLPPSAEDTENGSMWINRCDDFLTYHRVKNHPDRWMESQFHTRKIKELETGGGITEGANPVIFKLLPGGVVYDCYCEAMSNNNVYEDESTDKLPF